MTDTIQTSFFCQKNAFIHHIDDWIEYLCLLIDRIELDHERVKYERQLRWILGFREGSNSSIHHNLMISEIYANIYDEGTPEEPKTYTPILDYYKLGDHAFREIEKAMNCPHLYLLQGPPGTGKTTAIVELVLQTLRENPNARILITSETHVAVDNAIDRLSSVIGDDKLYTILRYKQFSKGTQLENPKAEIAEFENKANQVWTDAYLASPALTEILWKRLATKDKRTPGWLAKNIADKHQIIGITCNQIEHLIDKLSEPFDLAIVDECSKATLPEWLMPLSVSTKGILVGDHKQLPPTFCGTESEALSNLSKCQEKLIRDGVIDKLFNNAPSFMKGKLLTQYRMQPNIGEFISQVFYDGQLNHGRTQVDDPALNFGWLTYSTNTLYPDPDIKELVNELEISLIDSALKTLSNRGYKLSVAVITPYVAQSRALRENLKKYESSSLTIEIDTVDAFQGKQADIVFFSFVRNNGSAQFYGDGRRLNVALSRGKNKVYLVGSLDYIKQQQHHYILRRLSKLPKIKSVN